MYKTLVENYVKKMTLEDLKNYCKKNYPEVTEKEIAVIYRYLKNNWEALYGKDTSILSKLKEEVSEKTFLEITKLLELGYQLMKR